MINGKTPKEGDTLILKCGGRIVCLGANDVNITGQCYTSWTPDGRFVEDGLIQDIDYPINIVDIEAAPVPKTIIRFFSAGSFYGNSKAAREYDPGSAVYKVTLTTGHPPQIEEVK